MVTSIMKYVRSEIVPSLGEGELTKKFVKYRCPNTRCVNPIVRFLEESEFSNPYRHLFSCYARNQSIAAQQQVVSRLLAETRTESQRSGGSIHDHFSGKSLSSDDKAIHAYLNFILAKNLPLCTVQPKEFLALPRYDIPIRVDKITHVIYKIVELVEEEIKKEMQELSGAILYDGWSCNNMHFTALVVLYCSTTKVHDKNGCHQYSTPRLTLIAISPMGKLQNCDDED